MSYKDGIPLLTTFEDEPDDPDDYMLRSVIPKRRCNRRTVLLGVVFSFAFVLVVGLVISVSLGVTLNKGGSHPSEGGHRTTYVPTPSPTPLPPCSDDTQICPSPMDDRTYDFKVLDNGLRVVLISDPSTDLEGASVNVASGSFNDPSNLTGLAHFCEHMLFLGTHKYQEENMYSNYLSTHGGYDNAYTSTQETNFHFRVNAGFLRLPLDMLAQFFISPLFTRNSTYSEMFAVNQEHEKNLHSDGWKLWQLLKEVSNPAHPFSQFSTGNFDTLNKTGVNEELQRYYDKNYIAKNINVAVYGRADVSKLFEWVKESFSNVSDVDGSAATYPTSAFPPGYTGKLVFYQPEASTHLLTIYWPTPPLQGFPRNAIADFLTRYLGHEGEGSILCHLREEGLATKLTSGIEVDADSFSLFSTQITLTDAGRDDIGNVIQAVFRYAYLLANLTETEFNTLWSDFVNTLKVTFDYAENSYPNDYAVSITRVMRVVKNPADFLPNPRRYLSNYFVAISIAKLFVPSNSLIFITTNPSTPTGSGSGVGSGNGLGGGGLGGGVAAVLGGIEVPTPVLNMTEKIYQTPYSKIAIPDNLLRQWSYEQAIIVNELSLPPANIFVPSSLELLPSSNMTMPQRTAENATSETWFLQDTQNFQQPKANIRCELRPGQVYLSPLWAGQTRIFASLVKALLQPTLYGATEVGYDYDVTATERGITFSLSGLSDREILKQIISEAVSEITVLVREGDSVDEDIFNLVLNDLRNTLTNYNFTTLPFRYTLRYLQKVIMERPYWTNEKILSAVSESILRDVRNFVTSSFLQNVSVTCLAHGNVDVDAADSYARIVTVGLRDDVRTPPTPSGGFPRVRVRLPMTGDYGVSLQAFNPQDDNSVVNVIYQVGPICNVTDGRCSSESVKTSVYLALLRQVIADECFTQLRTKEKLGYVVSCFSRAFQGVGSFQVLVQSQQFLPQDVLNSIDRFLQAFYNNTINSEEFNFTKNMAVLKQTLTKRDLNLVDKTDKLWDQILSGQNQFDFVNQQAKIMESLSMEEFRMFYNTYILEGETRRKLVVVVYGKDKEFTPPVQYLIQYDQLNQTNSTLPLQHDT